MQGTLVLIVGPSGAGKDTLIDGARGALSSNSKFVFVKRTITRPSSSTGEDHDTISVNEFEQREKKGEYFLSWEAHGLKYGIPSTCLNDLLAGRNVIANVSRNVITKALKGFSKVMVIEITASPRTLATRLRNRARETSTEIQSRLKRETSVIPRNAVKVTIINDNSPENGIKAFLSTLRMLQTSANTLIQNKISGSSLNYIGYKRTISEILANRFDDQHVKNFLVAITETLTRKETVHLARARAEFSDYINWETELVVDKHSMGGVPGSRITLIVIPIVAAYGMTIPKTSSRAITSAAGTADAMEVLARVDLDRDDVLRVVRKTSGCIAWNGRLNHSRIDTLMNKITRPLRLDSLKWSVASILSKKLAAGITHCTIDIPLGPFAKVKTQSDANKLKDLFHYVGESLGLILNVKITNGLIPVGKGIGPALEARDAVAVLKNTPDAPSDLRKKALEFASAIIGFNSAISSVEAETLANNLLDTGKAWDTFSEICAEQGPPPQPIKIGAYSITVEADTTGTLDTINCFHLAGIARESGAPLDKGAGIDLFARVGENITQGQPLYRIYSSSEQALNNVQARVKQNSAFNIITE